MPIDLNAEVRAGVRVVSVSGELDLDTAPQLQAVLGRSADDAQRPLVIDLRECAFIDSAGLAALLHGAKPMQDGESNVAVVCSEGQVRELLVLTAIDRTLPVFDTLEDAIARALASE